MILEIAILDGTQALAEEFAAVMAKAAPFLSLLP